MTYSIRVLKEIDLLAADEVLKLAFGGPFSRVDDLRLYQEIQPDGWFVAEKDERIVGMVGAANYGAIAHVGLMAVRPDCQRQGIGRALMEHLLAHLEEQQVPLVTLDASQKGQPLYEKLGFVPYDETYTYQHPSSLRSLTPPMEVERLTFAELDELVEVDGAVFGVQRRKIFEILLNRFADRCLILRDVHGKIEGYLFAQKFRIGPWVMLRPGKEEMLLQAALHLPFEGIISLTIPSSNQPAVELLQRYGFHRVRTNRRMGKGQDHDPCQREKIYSQTSLSAG